MKPKHNYAKEHYFEIIDRLLEPIVRVENILIVDEEVNLLTPADMHQELVELVRELKLIKVDRYQIIDSSTN